MNRIKQTIIALAIGLSLANCGDDFLDTTSSDQMSDLWGIERSGFFNGREKWAKGFENQRV